MSTVNSPEQIRILEETHPAWVSQFKPAQRERQLHDDATALGQVSLLLMSIVTLGFLLICGTSVAILLTH